MDLLKCVELRNGVKMPLFGLGTWQMKDRAECKNAVLQALQLGIRLIDTASCYGNEEFIREALDEFKGFDDSFKTANSKGVFITSKAYASEMGYEETYQACLNSLKRLNIPALDLYLLHWPGTEGLEKSDPKNAEVRVQAWTAMNRLLKEGKVRAIGVSNYLSHHLEQLAKNCEGLELPHVNQVELHPLCPCVDLRKTAEKMRIVIQAYSSLGTAKQQVLGHPKVIELAEKEKLSRSQLLLKWAIIPKSVNVNHMKENITVMSDTVKVSDESMHELSSIADRARVCWNPEQIKY